MDNNIKKPAYELLFITDIAEGVETAADTVNKFVSLVEANGEIIDKSEWGKRHLEYPINDRQEGYYTVVTFRSEPDFPAELERLLNIDEKVMRCMTVRLDEEVAEKAARRAEDRKAAAAAAAEAEAAAAEAQQNETDEPAAEAETDVKTEEAAPTEAE